MNRRNKLGWGLAVTALGLMVGTTMLAAQSPAQDNQNNQDNNDSDSQSLNVLLQGPNESWLGVDLRDVTSAQARDWKLGDEYGALVKSVEPDSPAAKAGLQSGDVIQEFAGQKVHSVAELRRMVNETPAGRAVEIEVRRNGDKKTLSATLEHRNNAMGPLMSHLRGMRDNIWPDVNLPAYNFSFDFGGPRLGVEVDALSPQLGAYFGVKDGKGVLVREVKEGSAAEKAGLKAGDCIVKLDSTPVESADDLHRALLNREREKKQDMTLTIVRNHAEQTLNVHIETQPRQGVWHTIPDTALNGQHHGELEAQVSQGLDAQELAKQAQELRQQFQSEQGEFQKDAESARAQAEQLPDQVQQFEKEKGQWLKQNGTEMQELQRQLKRLRDSAGSDII